MSAGVRRSFSPPRADAWREWATGPLDLEAGIPALLLSYFDPSAGTNPTWESFTPFHCYQPSAGVLIRDGAEHRWGDAESFDVRDGHADIHGPHDDSLAGARARDIVIPDWGEAEYRARVEEALVHLRAEEIGKVVMARQCRVILPEAADLRHILSGMLRQPHSFTVCYSPDGERYFVSATPERLGRIAGGRFDTMALAGTLTGNAAADDTSGREGNGTGVLSHDKLLDDRKERAEHAYVVDMIREAAGTFATDVTTRDARVLELPHLRHILTGIGGRMRTGCGLRHAIAALHPTPAVAGTPRAEAMRLISGLEPFDRGMYAGCAGWFLGEEEGDCAVTIRSALLRGREAMLWAGAGIVRGSDAAAEERETRAKLRTMLGILGG